MTSRQRERDDIEIQARAGQSYGSTTLWNFFDLPPTHGEVPSAGWDYVFVFRAPKWANKRPSKQQQRIDTARRSFLRAVSQASFSYHQMWVPSTGKLFVRVGLPENAMKEKAEAFEVLLRVRSGFGGGYLPFSQSRSSVFKNEGRRLRALPYFTPAERLFITQLTLLGREAHGADINKNEMMHAHVLKSSFALHARKERDALLKAAVKTEWWNPLRGMPLYALYEYFGPKVTLYLAWMNFYTRMLIGIALLSLPVYVIIIFSPWMEVRLWTQLLFGVALSFWSSYWLQTWQRRNEVMNVRWGVLQSDDNEENILRDDFNGVNTEGFYCQGGFVHLDDMAQRPVRDQRVEEEDGDNSTDSCDSDDSPILRRTESTTYAPEHYEDDVESEDSYVEDVRQRASSQRTTLASLVRNEPPPWEEALIVGESQDEDFKLTASKAWMKFTDLPIVPYCSRKIVRKRVMITSIITLLFALLVGTISFLILHYRAKLNKYLGLDKKSSVLSGNLTALLIIMADKSWKKVSTLLTKWENHHTNQAFENSLIRKRFAFQFVSNYLSLFYIAFVKPFTPFNSCRASTNARRGCLQELHTQLASIVIAKASISQLLELVLPSLRSFAKRLIEIPSKLFQRLRLRVQSEGEEALLQQGATILPRDYLSRRPKQDTYSEEDDIRATLDESQRLKYQDTIQDYGEIVIQHGFLVLFGVSFPLAALINLASNTIEVRTDTYKLLRIYRRPQADTASDIGTWLPILNIVTFLSIATTVGLFTITTPTLQVILQHVLPVSVAEAAFKYPFMCFLIAEHVLLLVRWLVTFMIAEKPASTYRMRARQNFLLARCFGVGIKPFHVSHRDSSTSPLQSSSEI